MRNQLNPSTCMCEQCGEPMDARRRGAGYVVCRSCGESNAVIARATWCVVQQYGKGGYQYTTAESARQILAQTNQKQIREA